MTTNSETKLFCLIGHPTSGSKSPVVHSAIFDEMNINGSFINFDIEPNQLDKALDGLKTVGVKGFSVTIPYKELVVEKMDELHPSAKAMGSVNSVRMKDGKFIGYNTDGDGLIMALEEAGVTLEGARILVLGAGGASRGIVHALARQSALFENPIKLALWNRTSHRAKLLVDEVYQVHGADFAVVEDPHAPELLDVDLVINTTSIGMMPDVDQSPCQPELYASGTTFCDIVYKPHQTQMLKRAADSGHKIVFGIDMLIYQAILSEMYWHEGEADNPFDSGSFSLKALKKIVLDQIK